MEGSYYLHHFSNESTYTQNQQKILFFKENIVYTSVQHVQVKGGITISNNEKLSINFLPATDMSSL